MGRGSYRTLLGRRAWLHGTESPESPRTHYKIDGDSLLVHSNEADRHHHRHYPYHYPTHKYIQDMYKMSGSSVRSPRQHALFITDTQDTISCMMVAPEGFNITMVDLATIQVDSSTPDMMTYEVNDTCLPRPLTDTDLPICLNKQVDTVTTQWKGKYVYILEPSRLIQYTLEEPTPSGYNIIKNGTQVVLTIVMGSVPVETALVPRPESAPSENSNTNPPGIAQAVPIMEGQVMNEDEIVQAYRIGEELGKLVEPSMSAPPSAPLAPPPRPNPYSRFG